MKIRITAFVILILATLLAFFAFNKFEGDKFPYKFGLDIAGGTHLVYKADVSGLEKGAIKDSMDSLRDVIERRTNLFGVAEPLVQTEKTSNDGVEERRLIVELPGVTDIKTAVEMIGQTPLLEFKLLKEGENETDIVFESTGVTGRFVEKAQLQFNSTTGEPVVLLSFDNEGTKLFADISESHIGEVLAIFLDDVPISTPIIQDKIIDGKAQITGDFTPQEAKLLVRDINYGALPVPIELISTQNIGASIGEDTLDKGLKAGFFGFIIVASFLILWYRLPGLLATLSLFIYISLVLALFKLIPITLTSAGIAGFILSIGMAVDANILIFERMKEELRAGLDIRSAILEGFKRAWLSIRDSNISSIITAIILFWFGTSLVEGFALTFGLGVIVSMFTAITITRTFILALSPKKDSSFKRFFFLSGFNKE